MHIKPLPLLVEDAAVLRFVQLSAGARAYDAQRVLDIAKRAYREAREETSAVQLKMRQGDESRIGIEYFASRSVAAHVKARINNREDVAECLRLLVVY